MCQASSRETSGGASSIRWDGGVSNSNRTRTDGWTDRQHPLVLSRFKLVPSRLVSRPWLLAIMIIVLLVAIVTHSHSPPRELRSNLCRIQNIILDSMYHAQWQWEAVYIQISVGQRVCVWVRGQRRRWKLFPLPSYLSAGAVDQH